MVDIDTVRVRLGALNEYIAQLEAKRGLSLEQMLADLDQYQVVLHRLQMACQVSIDLASHILASDFSQRVDRYRDVILALGSEGVLPQEVAQRFAGVAGFLNIVIHEYLVVDPAKVYQLLVAGPDDFRVFAGYITKYLQRTGVI